MLLYMITKLKIPGGPMKVVQLEEFVIGMTLDFSTSNE